MDWISVDEQLPIDEQPENIDFRTRKVLGFKDGCMAIGYFFKWEYHDIHFACGRNKIDFPTHWMPLPEPPE